MRHRTGNKRTPNGLLSDTNKAATIVPPIVAGATVAVERSAATVVPFDRRPACACERHPSALAHDTTGAGGIAPSCHYDPATERYSECDGHHRCICPDDETVTAPRQRRLVITCRCCQRPYQLEAWRALPPAAGGLLWDLGEDGGVVEVRNCPCGNTLYLGRDAP